MTLPALQLSFHGLPDQVGPLLAFDQGGVDPIKGTGRKPGRRLFVVDLLSSHGPKINDITYVDKPKIPDIIYPSKREMNMTKTGHEFYSEAVALRARILSGKSNEPAVMAWASVCRACAKASNAYRREFNARSFGTGYTRSELSTLNNLEAVWFTARAQVETLGRAA
jgi:hypothetical protein